MRLEKIDYFSPSKATTRSKRRITLALRVPKDLPRNPAFRGPLGEGAAPLNGRTRDSRGEQAVKIPTAFVACSNQTNT